jgi:hypothetical protein
VVSSGGGTGHKAVVRLLLSHAGMEVNSKDNDGARTPALGEPDDCAISRPLATGLLTTPALAPDRPSFLPSVDHRVTIGIQINHQAPVQKGRARLRRALLSQVKAHSNYARTDKDAKKLRNDE